MGGRPVAVSTTPTPAKRSGHEGIVVEDFNGQQHRYPPLVANGQQVEQGRSDCQTGKADEHDGDYRVPHEGRVTP